MTCPRIALVADPPPPLPPVTVVPPSPLPPGVSGVYTFPVTGEVEPKFVVLMPLGFIQE